MSSGTQPRDLIVLAADKHISACVETLLQQRRTDLEFSPENSWRVPIPVQTQEPPCGTSAVLTTTCATTEALA